ncbi:MAG TPA: choice-of-anchor L domain-containing protein [Bacteroidia bacterium]|nr:choice-of-anchor L domain-containing protein [Bacteroidia bacterium]
MKNYFSEITTSKVIALLFCSALFLPAQSYAQISVASAVTTETMINSFVGPVILVTNVQLNCGTDTGSTAYGNFIDVNSSIGLSHGIILTTGSATNVLGPNAPGDSATTGNGSHYSYQDPQLVLIAGDSIHDLCSFEFDVFPNCSPLQLRFVFGSEEYPEFVNAFNDAFGIFVTGPDSNCNAGFYDNTNVALLTDGTPISVNTVNNGHSNGCPSTLPGPCMNCAYYVNNCSGSAIEYDGFTTAITVTLPVCPCATYHFKFAIADSRDDLYDSGVLIESFGCVAPLYVQASSTESGCLCQGTATANIVSGTPPFSFLWSTGQATQTIANLCAGVYTVLVMDANSCVPFFPTPGVIVHELAVTTNTENVTCQAYNNGYATAFADGGTPPYSFLWDTSPPQTTPVATNLAAGVWGVTVTDVNGCSAFTQATILEPDSFFIILPTTAHTSCDMNNGYLQPQYVNGTFPLTYLWSTNPPQILAYAGSLAPGIYTVTATDANGCTATASSTVLPSPDIETSGDITMCEGNQALIEAYNFVTYTWSPSYGLYQTTGSSQYAHPEVTTTYMIIGSCYNGVRDTTYLTVTVLPQPDIIVSPPQEICQGSSTTLTVSGGVHYNWVPSDYIISASPDSSSIVVQPSVNRNYLAYAYDSIGCYSFAPVPVIVNPKPNVTIYGTGPTVFCEGGYNILYTTIQGTYLWSTEQTFQSIVVSTSGYYTVTVTDVNGCTGTSTVLIIVNPKPVPVITAGSATELCQGDIIAVNLSVSPTADHYLWSTGQNTQSILANNAGPYFVTITDDRNCSGTTSIDINVHPFPPAIISPTGPVLACSNSPALFQANTGAGYSYQWYFNNILLAAEINPQLSATSAGFYSVIVADAYGCSFSSAPVEVVQGTGPDVSVTASPSAGCIDNTIYTGYGLQNVTLTAVSVNAISYLWSTGETSQSISVSSGGTFSVTAYDANGCPSPQTSQSQITINTVDVRCGHDLKKIILCHVPEGNPSNPQTICISSYAIPAHLTLHQYDCLGPCPSDARVFITGGEEEGWIMYPNPAGNKLAVGNRQSVISKIQIYNVLGEEVLNRKQESDSHKHEILIDISSFTPGIYFVRVKSENTEAVMKLVKE